MGTPVNFYSGTQPINFYNRPGISTTNAFFYLPGDDTISDFMGRHTLTVHGGVTIDNTVSAFGTGSIKFDGAEGSYLTVDSSPVSTDFDVLALTPFTLDFSVMFNSFPTAGGNFVGFFWTKSPSGLVDQFSFFMNKVGADSFFRIYMANTSLSVSDEVISNAVSLSLSSWYRVTYVINGTNAKIYLNNSLIADDTLNSIARPASGFSADIEIGQSSSSTADFNGWIDDLIWYNVAQIPGGQPVNFYSLP
jgi:hypothetical protein